MNCHAQERVIESKCRQARLLIVDDDVLLLAVMAEHFRTLGYDVHTASESEEAEALLSNYKYALVITDLALTKVGFRGLEILDHTWDLCDRPRIIVLTGHVQPEIQIEATTRGIDRFMCKPVRLRQLTQAAEQLLGATA